MEKLSTGIHVNIPMADYLSQCAPGPAVQGTDLKRLDGECPAFAHALWSGNPDRFEEDETRATEFGSAFHMLLMEPELFSTSYAIKPEDMSFSTKEGKSWRARVEESSKKIVTAKEHCGMIRMRDSIAAHPIGRKVIERKSLVEATMIAQDPITGLWLKCRPDYLMPDAPAMTVNLKTAQQPNPAKWQRQASELGYHISAAMTIKVAKLLGLHDALPYAFLVVGSKPPHLPFVATLKDDAIKWGGIIVDKALERWADCLESGKWPGYGDDVVEIDLPPWEHVRLQKAHEAGMYQLKEIAK